MHPAYSVIFFTTASGAGYGLLFWLSVAEMFGGNPFEKWGSVGVLALSLVLVTAGLLASAFHLGHPERAVRALSQWRSSWLSREGVAAVATYLPCGLLGIAWLLGLPSGVAFVFAFLSAAGAVATVYCTGMIYASLPTIRQWNRADVPWIYLLLAAATGGVLFTFLNAFTAESATVAGAVVLAFLIGAGGLKWRYWTEIDADKGAYTTEMALGMPDLGQFRPLDPPHTMPNFVMREMGYSVARNHALRLRRIASLLLFILPTALILIAMLGGFQVFLLGIACLSGAIGVVMERWLFFAEAEHVSQLYYGKSRA